MSYRRSGKSYRLNLTAAEPLLVKSVRLGPFDLTAKNFTGSYHDPARMVTQQYPEQPAVLPENYRNFPFLIAENATDPMGTLRCVACQICEKECPPQCIIIEKSKDKKPDASGKMQLYPAIFGIDTSVCMSCQICVEVCPFDALHWSPEFEYAELDIRDLLHEKPRLGQWMATVPQPPALDPKAAEPQEITAANKPPRVAPEARA